MMRPMGKLTFDDQKNNATQPVKSMINNNIDSYMDSTADYSRYLQGSPNFVTYYAVDMLTSTTDVGLGNNIEQVGAESPIKYNKINNFPIFGVEDIQPAFDYDQDTGIDGSMEGQAVIAPQTIQPQPNDYFIFTYHEHKLDTLKLFRVSNVNESAINNQTFYQITFIEENGVDPTYLEGRQKAGEYEALYENIGTEKLPIVEEGSYQSSLAIQKSLAALTEVYKEFYWNRKLNSFVLETADGYIYDGSLHRFIQENDLFIDKNSFLTDIYVENQLNESLLSYRQSLYYSFLTYRDTKELTLDYMLNATSARGAFLTYDTAMEVVSYLDPRLNLDGLDSKHIFPININDIIPDYQNKQSINGLGAIERVLVKYLAGHLDELDTEDLTKLNKYLATLTRADMSSYMLLPLVMYVLREGYNHIFLAKEDDLYK